MKMSWPYSVRVRRARRIVRRVDKHDRHVRVERTLECLEINLECSGVGRHHGECGARALHVRDVFGEERREREHFVARLGHRAECVRERAGGARRGEDVLLGVVHAEAAVERVRHGAAERCDAHSALGASFSYRSITAFVNAGVHGTLGLPIEKSNTSSAPISARRAAARSEIMRITDFSPNIALYFSLIMPSLSLCRRLSVDSQTHPMPPRHALCFLPYFASCARISPITDLPCSGFISG